MRAIRVHAFGGPEVLTLEEVPDPPSPGPGQVLVRVRAAGVNPVDTYIRSGGYGAASPALPYTPGSDAGGEVEAVGPGVTHLRLGDRAYALGTTAGRHAGAYAEHALCEAWQVHPVPSTMSFAQAAAVGVPCATAYRALFQRARAVPAVTVLVHGASGGVGIASVQLARAHGLRVIATVGTERGRDLVRMEGAGVVFDHTAPGYRDEVRAATPGGRGVDLILEMAAHVNLGHDLELLAPRGRVVVIGSRGDVEVTPRLAMARDAAVLGMALWNATPEEMASIHAALVAALASGTLRPVVGRELPLAEAPRAHVLVMAPGALGKIALVP